MLDAWSGGMTRVARSIVSTYASADEVVQDTWLAVIQGIDTFEGRSSLKTWVYRILVNTAKRRACGRAGTCRGAWCPARTTRPRSIRRGSAGPAIRSRGTGWRSRRRGRRPSRTRWPARCRPRWRPRWPSLPERQRVVITLRDVEGYSSDEVCSILRIIGANQRVLLHRARAFVRGKLEAVLRGVRGVRHRHRGEAMTDLNCDELVELVTDSSTARSTTRQSVASPTTSPGATAAPPTSTRSGRRLRPWGRHRRRRAHRRGPRRAAGGLPRPAQVDTPSHDLKPVRRNGRVTPRAGHDSAGSWST